MEDLKKERDFFVAFWATALPVLFFIWKTIGAYFF